MNILHKKVIDWKHIVITISFIHIRLAKLINMLLSQLCKASIWKKNSLRNLTLATLIPDIQGSEQNLLQEKKLRAVFII